MANRTDPLVNSVSGSDPQNCMEYITRQRIYDCRYWKEVCFGLSVEDVLEKSVQQLKCIGSLPYTSFMSLTLKLLQLNAEHEIIQAAFIDQDEFKYTRALGALYIRLTSRPAEIYESLEPLYSDYSKLRVYQEGDTKNPFSICTMDQYIHQLLTSVVVLGITLPRLPPRRSLVEAGYLMDGPRPTALLDVIRSQQQEEERKDDNDDDDEVDLDKYYDAVTRVLAYKAHVEKSPAAIIEWDKRRGPVDQYADMRNKERSLTTDATLAEDRKIQQVNAIEARADHDSEPKEKLEKKSKSKKQKKERNYNNLFKQKETTKISKSSSISTTAENTTQPSATKPIAEEGSDEFWNEQRAILGLKPLK